MNIPPHQQRRTSSRSTRPVDGPRRTRVHGSTVDRDYVDRGYADRDAVERDYTGVPPRSTRRQSLPGDDYRTQQHRSNGVTPRERSAGRGWQSLVEDGDFRRWIPIGVIALLAVGLAGFALSGQEDGAQAAGSTTVPGSIVDPVATSMEAQPMQSVETSSPVQKTTLSRTIDQGMSGEDVKAIQDRLIELGYDPGPADGVYGKQTISAMWAFKKLVMEVEPADVTDEVTPAEWDRMQDPVQVAPRRPNASSVNHIEIYLPQQVMVLFYGDTPRLITHISTGELDENGNPAPYCEDIVRTIDKNGAPLEKEIPGEACGEAKTPGGIFKIHRMEEGYHEGVLGGMWEPVYFNFGIAIHGALQVPLYPASHGCIRIERHISGYFQTLVAKGDEVAVWNGVQEPDEVSEDDALPYFDRFTPDSTVPETAPPTQAPSTAAPTAAPEVTPGPTPTQSTTSTGSVPVNTPAPTPTSSTTSSTTSTTTTTDAPPTSVETPSTDAAAG